MGEYRCGDVILVSLLLPYASTAKARPAIILETRANGELAICPVSSKPSFDSRSVPLSLGDFSRGGLDLFSESFVLVAHRSVIKNRDVIGKRGQLSQEAFERIVTLSRENSG